jgi:RNA polymerase sigma-70 factor (ECF subfamily)
MKDSTDEELFRLVQLNDERAFSALFDRYKTQIFRHIYQRIKSTAESEEILQNIFISVWKNRLTIVIKDSLRPYLMGAARNCVFEYYARTARDTAHTKLLTGIPEHIEYPAEEFIIASELEGLIDTEVQKMPATMQQIFRLSRNQHASVRQIALMLSISEQTVKNNITMALKRLRGVLSSRFMILFLILALFLT